VNLWHVEAGDFTQHRACCSVKMLEPCSFPIHFLAPIPFAARLSMLHIAATVPSISAGLSLTSHILAPDTMPRTILTLIAASILTSLPQHAPCLPTPSSLQACSKLNPSFTLPTARHTPGFRPTLFASATRPQPIHLRPPPLNIHRGLDVQVEMASSSSSSNEKASKSRSDGRDHAAQHMNVPRPCPSRQPCGRCREPLTSWPQSP